MGFKVAYNSNLNVIQIDLSGDVSLSDLNNAAKAYVTLSRDESCSNFLIDATHQTDSPSLSDLYNRPKFYYDQNFKRTTVVAYVMPHSPKARKAARFWETVCYNRGWQIQMFEKSQDAEKYIASIHNEDT